MNDRSKMSIMEKAIADYGIETVSKWLKEAPERAKLINNWKLIRRPGQTPPGGNWTIWALICGRGYGKTRTGVSWCLEKVAKGHRYGAIVVPTNSEIKKIIVNGESGFFNVCEPDQMPVYNSKDQTLIFPNEQKTVINIFSAEKADRLRGQQCSFGWCDELCSFRRLTGDLGTWDMLMFGLRLQDCNEAPQVLVTTTPRPIDMVRNWVKNPDRYNAVITEGDTHENSANLAPEFYNQIISQYRGTRLEVQEVQGKILDDNPESVFDRDNIEKTSIYNMDRSEITTIAIAVDPAVSDDEGSDDTGIVVVGNDSRDPRHFYVLGDHTINTTTKKWAQKVVDVYNEYKANFVVCETNQGGDLVKLAIHNISKNISVRKVHATRGKIKRAEPIGMLYEQNRVHHLDVFPHLVDEMCSWSPDLTHMSPNRMDAVVWGLSYLSRRGGSSTSW